MRNIGRVVGAAVAAAVSGHAAVCAATVYTVDCSGGADFATIQAAVDASANRDTVLVAPCVYAEEVVVSGKCLTIVGSGPSSCELTAPGSLPALTIGGMPSPWVFVVEGVRVSGTAGGEAIRWDTEQLALRGCAMSGVVLGTGPRAHVRAVDCSFDDLQATGGGRLSQLTGCSANAVRFYGYSDLYSRLWHDVESSHCEYDLLRLGLADATLGGDLVGEIKGISQARITASGSRLGPIDMWGGVTELEDCEVDGPIRVHGWSYEWGDWFGKVSAVGCLVFGDIDIELELGGESVWASLFLAHNTILGHVRHDVTCGSYTTVWPHHVRSNIITGYASLLGDWGELGPPVVTHNDVLQGIAVPAVADSVFANFGTAPLFCDSSAEDYGLQDCSPCVGMAHDGGDVGAFGVSCPCASSVELTSWGVIKAMYRRQPSS